jgi:hypothetical protein
VVGDYTYALGVDPGTTTGLACVQFALKDNGRPVFTWCDQLPWDEAGDRFENALPRLIRLRDHGVPVAVAVERFTINAQTGQRGQKGADDAMGMIGVVRRYCAKNDLEMGKMQTASAAKALVGDDLLKRLDLHARGMKHANDAMRHAVHLAVSKGWMHRSWLAAGL